MTRDVWRVMLHSTVTDERILFALDPKRVEEYAAHWIIEPAKAAERLALRDLGTSPSPSSVWQAFDVQLKEVSERALLYSPQA